MFYVSNDRIYSMTKNEKLNVYPEVYLVEGRPVPRVTGLRDKPRPRSVCTLQELLAKFGPNHPQQIKK
nr:MAG TPA: hypothetical protein [Caudoviricetes sp.]